MQCFEKGTSLAWARLGRPKHAQHQQRQRQADVASSSRSQAGGPTRSKHVGKGASCSCVKKLCALAFQQLLQPPLVTGQRNIVFDIASNTLTSTSMQAKALDSVLKEVNQRFGKGSIMKLGGTSIKV